MAAHICDFLIQCINLILLFVAMARIEKTHWLGAISRDAHVNRHPIVHVIFLLF